MVSSSLWRQSLDVLDIFTPDTPEGQQAVFISLSILIGSIVLERILIFVIRRAGKKDSWKGADVLAQGLNGQVILFGIAVALYTSAQLLHVLQSGIRTALIILCILIGTNMASKILAGLVRAYTTHKTGLQTTSILPNITKIILLTIGLLMIGQQLGVRVAPLLGALGIGGLAAALAFKDTLENLFAGINILTASKIHIGDFVEVNGTYEGYVKDITWRNTTLRTLEGSTFIIPNALLQSGVIKNSTLHRTSFTVTVSFQVTYNSTLDAVERIAREVGAEVMNTVNESPTENDPIVRFKQFGPTGIEVQVFLRSSSYAKRLQLKHLFILNLQKQFLKEKISFAQQLVELKRNTK